MSLTHAENIWNRAALARGGPTPRNGDRALVDLLFAHGLVMNGGVDHLFDAASEEQIAAAVRGFRFFGFDGVAELLDEVTNGNRDPQEANDRYGELVSSDDVLSRAFEAFLSSSPDAFDPLEDLPCAGCGFLTLSEETYGSYGICQVCGWEDDGVQLANPASGGGANKLSLIEMQTDVLRSLPVTVTEHKGVVRSRSWRPLSPSEIARAQSESALQRWTNGAVVSRWECYWNGGRPLPRNFPHVAG
ncbi:MAG TPA: CPCC family cysteine-rich protein [Polyangiaceae bacterium]|nr:CPCC family cysteine-rich protein [Polyangiaceae bacterium]